MRDTRIADLRREIHTLQAHVQHLNTDLARIPHGLFPQYRHDLFAFARHHLVDGALAELFAHAGVNRLHQSGIGPHLIAADADVKLLYIHDAPFDEGSTSRFSFPP